MSSMQTGQVAAVAAALLWTLSTVAWALAGRRIGSLAVCFHRLLITSAFLVLYGGLVRHRWLPSDADGRTWLLLGLSGFMGFFLSDACSFKALLLIGPRVTVLFQSLVPPLAALIAWQFLGETLTVRHWAAMAVTLSGITWVILERRPAGAAPAPRGHLAAGLLLALLGAMTHAVAMVLSRQGMLGHYDAVAATFIRVIGALPGYVILFTVLRHWPAAAAGLRHTRAMGIVVLGSVVGPFLGVIAYMVALENCRAGVVATILATMPVLVLPFAILLFREKVSFRAAAGAVISVLGVALMCW